jgi:hypothetical protein
MEPSAASNKNGCYHCGRRVEPATKRDRQWKYSSKHDYISFSDMSPFFFVGADMKSTMYFVIKL